MKSHEDAKQKGGTYHRMNLRKLRAKMVEEDVNVEALSKELKMSTDALYRRFRSGSNLMTVAEAQKIAQILRLSGEEATEIFFGN